MGKIENEILALLDRGERFLLATILSQQGSTPRLPGTRMLVRADGRTVGTIGGGSVEAEVIAAGPQLLESGQAAIRFFDLKAGDTARGMDLICGGHLEILLEPVVPTEENRSLYAAMIRKLKTGEKGVMVAELSRMEHGSTVRRCLLSSDPDSGQGPLALSPEQSRLIWKQTIKQRAPILLELAGRRFLGEPLFAPGTVFLFGAGHVSRQVAKLAKMVEFRVVVLDDRETFANGERFPEADDIRVLAHFDQAFSGLAIDADSYLVILTRGHGHDQTVLAQALRTSAGYIGMIGSRAKRTAIYQALLKQGFSRADLDRVHSPIGVDIGAQTPEELGVSIVGELIYKRAGSPPKKQ